MNFHTLLFAALWAAGAIGIEQAAVIDEEIKAIINGAYETARKILTEIRKTSLRPYRSPSLPYSGVTAV